MAVGAHDHNIMAHGDRDSSSSDHEMSRASDRRPSLLGAKSPGVARAEAITQQFTTLDRVWLFSGLFIIAYAYGLDGMTRYTYQGYATQSFSLHSLLATINVLRAVVAAAAQPTAAKIADVFGRFELVLVSVFFYLLGTIVEATSHGVEAFCAGAVLYQVGYTCVLCLVEVIVADTTTMRWRVFFSYVPALPFLINTWVSGNVTESVLAVTSWRWGIGMWCIIYAVCSLPLLSALWWTGRKARKSGKLDSYRSPFQMMGTKQLAVELFHQLDVVGIILVIAVFALILTPLTIAGSSSGTSHWSEAKVLAPLVIGIVTVPVFVFWEWKGARKPLLPFHLLKDRGVWAALGIACTLNFAWYMQGDFLYAVLYVAFDFGIAMSTRVTSFYSFFSVVSGVIASFVIYKTRRLKPFIVAGTCLFMVAFGLLIYYRGNIHGANKSGIIGAQVLLGLAGGLFPYPAQASIQAATQHEHVAIVTGLYLACYSIGSGLGSSVSGTIWTQHLARTLERNLAFQPNATLAQLTYAMPYAIADEYPIGTPERTAIVESYMSLQHTLCIVGVCLCVPLIGFALLLRNPRLSETQSQPEAEKGRADQ